LAKKPAVVFDIGNVFVHWDPRHLYRQHFDNIDEMEKFLCEVTSPAWNLEQDRGRSFADAVELLSDDFPHYSDLIRLFDSHWTQTLGDEISGTVDILDTLIEADMPVYAITNFSAEKWPIFCERHDFTKKFLDVIVSGEEKIVKPDPRIYTLAIDQFSLSPEASIFIDDSLDNVQAARSTGMLGHHFKNAPDLANDLKNKGFLP